MTRIHPTAIVDPQAELADDVEIGAYVTIDGRVKIGPGTVIRPSAHLIGPLTLGARNMVHSQAVLGDWPQDRKFNPQIPSETIIGDENVFRENVTVHRGTGAGTRTQIGSRCYLMAGAHVAHNCTVADDVTMINASVLGGHVVVAERAIIGAHCAVHQFCRVGRLAMISNNSAHSVDVPPFFIAMLINHVAQLNAVGLRRSGVPRASISALRQVVQYAFRSNRPMKVAMEELPDSVKAVPEVLELKNFILASKRGVATYQAWSKRSEQFHEGEAED